MGLLHILWEIPHTPQVLLKAVQLIIRLLPKLVMLIPHQRPRMAMVVGVHPPLKKLGIRVLLHGVALRETVPEQLQLRLVTIPTQQGQHQEVRHGNLQPQKLEIHTIRPVVLQAVNPGTTNNKYSRYILSCKPLTLKKLEAYLFLTQSNNFYIR